MPALAAYAVIEEAENHAAAHVDGPAIRAAACAAVALDSGARFIVEPLQLPIAKFALPIGTAAAAFGRACGRDHGRPM